MSVHALALIDLAARRRHRRRVVGHGQLEDDVGIAHRAQPVERTREHRLPNRGGAPTAHHVLRHRGRPRELGLQVAGRSQHLEAAHEAPVYTEDPAAAGNGASSHP
jgi:hypothetical protein